jgi:hypothetical protein
MVPELNDVLCEACGYVLNGLPQESRCPECGKPIVESAGANRVAPLWEIKQDLRSYIRTSMQIIVHPTQFYRTTTVRGSTQLARSFATRHWWIAAVLFGLAGATHCDWYWQNILHSGSSTMSYAVRAGCFGLLLAVLTIAAYFSLDAITRLAAMLTNWEATYRGLRLPYDIVLRGMHYHAAHYFPVALLAAITVVGYGILYSWNVFDAFSATTYLYILSGEVILGAIYLFNTYWIGMRNMMYANR